MANEQTSGILDQLLTNEIIDTAFDIVRTNRSGILATVSMGKPRKAFEGYKMSWLEMGVGAAGSVSTAAATDAATTINVADGSVFRPDMLISAKGSDEVIRVVSVSGNTLTVARGFGGTAGEAITDASVLTIDSTGRKENSLAENDSTFKPVIVDNYFQTMDTAIEYSRRALATMQYGGTNDLKFQVEERIKQLAIQMDRVLIKGLKSTTGTGSDLISYTGGMRHFTNQDGAIKVSNASAALTLAHINNLNEKILLAGGTTNTIAVGVKQARVLSAEVSKNYASTRLADWSMDEGGVTKLPSDMPLAGSVNQIVIDTNLNDDELYLYNSKKIQIVPMASGNAKDSGSWRKLDATQKGQDGERVRIIGDFAIEARDTKSSMARLHGIG